MLSVEEASERILARVRPLEAEAVALDAALGRVLAADAIAVRALPPWDNSAMDGFAVRCAELPGTLPVAGTIAAGDDPDRELQPGTVLRIMTGAPVPRGADAIVMRENVEDRGETAHFAEPGIPARHVRRAGEDVAVGDRMIDAGTALGAGELGVLAAQGLATIRVGRRPRVALLSTGDELVALGVEPGPGQIVNSNALALAAQVREAGAEPLHLGIVGDDRAATEAAVTAALARADVLVTSGGVSVGDFDFVQDALRAAGVAIDFWKVAMKPGKPLVFGTTPAGALVFGLPGNPVSSMVVFELFARPALRALQGARAVARPRAPVVMTSAYRKQAGRAHFARTRLERDGAVLRARPHAAQGSGMLRSMVDVDALLVIGAEVTEVAAGAEVEALLLRPV